MQLIFPDNVAENTHSPGVCYVKSWPMLGADDIIVFADDGCAITKYFLSIDSTYTTAIVFTLDNVNSNCQNISCLIQSSESDLEVKHFRISKCYLCICCITNLFVCSSYNHS